MSTVVLNSYDCTFLKPAQISALYIWLVIDINTLVVAVKGTGVTPAKSKRRYYSDRVQAMSDWTSSLCSRKPHSCPPRVPVRGGNVFGAVIIIRCAVLLMSAVICVNIIASAVIVNIIVVLNVRYRPAQPFLAILPRADAFRLSSRAFSSSSLSPAVLLPDEPFSSSAFFFSSALDRLTLPYRGHQGPSQLLSSPAQL